MKLSRILRRAPKAPTLRERAAALRASLPYHDPSAEQGGAPLAKQPAELPAAGEPSIGAPEGHVSQVIWLRGGDRDREEDIGPSA